MIRRTSRSVVGARSRSSHSSPKTTSSWVNRSSIIDFDAGAKVAGSKFYFLRGDAVLLELGLIRYAMDILMEHGYQPTITPDVARDEALIGTGFIPRGPETQIYSVEDSDLSMIATAEIPLAGQHTDEILNGKRAAAALRGPLPLLPHRGWFSRPRQPRTLPRPPVHEGRDVRVLDAGTVRADTRGDGWD